MYPQPSVADAYRTAIQRHFGCEIDSDVVRRTIRDALRNRSQTDDLSTNEQAEHDFWAQLIRELSPTADGFQNCFDDLFDHFGNPEHWKCFDDVAETFRTLQKRGFEIGIGSNFDLRLNSVCDGLPQVAAATHRIISSVAGWRKPAPQFFDAVCQQLQLPAEQILLVGDDLVNDVQGAIAAGMPAVWLCRSEVQDACPSGAIHIECLTELLPLLPEFVHSDSVHEQAES